MTRSCKYLSHGPKKSRKEKAIPSLKTNTKDRGVDG